MLPTPHGPTDVPLPAGTGDATVDTGRTPDEVALLRVVEHLADVPDGEDDAGTDTVAETHDATTADDAGTDEAGTDDAGTDDAVPGAVDDEAGTAQETAPDDVAADVLPADDAAADAAPADDAPADDAPTDPEDAAPGATAAAPGPADAPEPPPVFEVGPVAAALSDTRHRIDELNPPEQLFLAQQRALVAGLCDDPSDAALVGALFDRVRAQWIEAEDRPDARPLADAFGIALGDLVCAQARDLRWATFSDRFGTEIVLASENPAVVVYPIAAVAQHWQDAAPGWFLRHLATVLQGVAAEAVTADA